MTQHCILTDSEAGGAAVMMEVEVEAVKDGWQLFFDQKMNDL